MKYFLFFLLTLLSFNSNASHFLAGEIYYNSIGNNDYELNLIIYRDCYTSGANFDNSVHFTVFDQSNNFVQNITTTYPGQNNVLNSPFTDTYNLNCFSTIEDTCVEYVIYSAIVNLPPINGGYNISYQRCCLTYEIKNVNFPEDNGLTLTCHIPGLETGNQINSSPKFANASPFVICDYNLTTFNHQAIDLDGDSLEYSIVPATTGASVLMPAPTSSTPPPYIDYGWSTGGYSTTNPLGNMSIFEIDSVTGIISTTPNGYGSYLLGIKVEEFRNGNSLGFITRNATIKVLNANATIMEIQKKQLIPNPTNGLIDLSKSEKIDYIKIVNINGVVIYEKSNPTYIDFQNAPKGTYLIELITEGIISRSKVIKR